MTAELERRDLGRKGEAAFDRLSAACTVTSHFGIALVLSEHAEARSEVRKRLSRSAPELTHESPSIEALQIGLRLGQSHAGSENPAVLWIELETSPNAGSWPVLLAAANREREHLREAGRLFVVFAGPNSLRDQVREFAPDLWTLAPPVLVFEDPPEQLLFASSGTVDWLHLSDLHLGRTAWQEDVVLAHLQRDLPDLVKCAGASPQLVFVTGDLAWSGRALHYERVNEFFADLHASLGLDPKKSLFLVPGNHDVDRSAIGRAARLAQTQLLGLGGEARDEFRRTVGELLDPRELEEFGRRLSSYCDFTGRILGPARSVSSDRPFRTDVREIAGVSVGIASLCSSWLCGPDDDRKGRIVLGERQVREALAELYSSGATLRIILLHHPLEWLHEAEDRAVRELLAEEADVVLHGHLHETDLAFTRSPFGDCVISAAGAACSGGSFPNTFQLARFQPDSGALTLHFFKYVSRGGGRWMVDHDLGPRTTDGKATLSLRRIAQSAGSTPGGTEALEALGARLKQAALRVYGRVDFVGLPDSAPKPRTKLQELYVPASFQRLNERATKSETKLSLPDLQHALMPSSGGDSTPISHVVLGDPGSGKSTLIHYLALVAARRPDAPVPIVVKLREYVRRDARLGLLAFAASECTELLQVPTEASQLEELAKAGQLLLLVDGLDEVAREDDRTRARDLLAGFASRFPHSAVLATSRIVGYDRAPLPAEHFVTLQLELFGDADIRRFFERWYQVAIPDDPRERQRQTADLLAALSREPRAWALARVPLLATLIALVHKYEANLPGERAALYDLCVKTLVITWPRARGRRFAALDEFLQRAVLESLALRLQEQRTAEYPPDRGISIGKHELVDALADIFEQRGRGGSRSERRTLAEHWVEWLQADTGLVVEQQPGVFGFLHLSLLEFLAARGLLEREGSAGDDAVARFIAQHHDDLTWRETCLLALGSESTRRKLVDVAVNAVLGQTTSPKGWDSWRFLLALLREEVDVRPEVRDRIVDGAILAATNVPPWQWQFAQQSLADSVEFGRRHGSALRARLQQHLGHATGKQLEGTVALAPESLSVVELLAQRSDSASAAAALLDFGPKHPAGLWARRAASRNALLTWVTECPGELIAIRSLEALTGAFEHAGAAGCLLMMRSASLRSQVVSRLPAGLVPSGVRWEMSAPIPPIETLLQPTWVVAVPPEGSLETTRSTDLARESALHFVLDYHSQAQDMTREFNLYVGDLTRHLTRDLTSDFIWGFRPSPARCFSFDFAQEFSKKYLRKSPVDFAPYVAANVSRQYFRDLVHHSRSGHSPQSLAPHAIGPFKVDVNLPSPVELREPWHALKESNGLSSVKNTAELMMAAQAWAGLALASTAELDIAHAAMLASTNVQDLWLWFFFEPFARSALQREEAGAPRDPTTVGLLLALGLRQVQSLGKWPWGQLWTDLVAEPVPEHWFAAYWWHTVRAVAEDDADRAEAEYAAADACLDRSDWPELAVELRRYRCIRTPPEISARFGSTLPSA